MHGKNTKEAKMHFTISFLSPKILIKFTLGLMLANKDSVTVLVLGSLGMMQKLDIWKFKLF